MTLKFLIVDDSKTILKMNSKLISKVVPDAEILMFNSGAEVVEVLSSLTFDFAFLDYNMEGMDGVELAQILLSRSPVPFTADRICILSANIQDAVVCKARDLGIGFIPKPMDELKLVQFLEQRGEKRGA